MLQENIVNDKANWLATAPVSKAFFKLAIPAVAAQLINILYNLVDKMFIGHIPGAGKQALASVGVTTPVISCRNPRCPAICFLPPGQKRLGGKFLLDNHSSGILSFIRPCALS